MFCHDNIFTSESQSLIHIYSLNLAFKISTVLKLTQHSWGEIWFLQNSSYVFPVGKVSFVIE